MGYYKISVSHGVQNPIPPLDPRMKGITNRLSPSCLCIFHVCLLVSLSFSHSVPLFIMVYMYIILTSSLIKPFRSTPPPLFVRSGVNRKHWLGKMLIYKQRLSSVFFFLNLITEGKFKTVPTNYILLNLFRVDFRKIVSCRCNRGFASPHYHIDS